MKSHLPARTFTSIVLLVAIALMPLSFARAQDPVTGALEGYVYDSANAPIPDALVQLINVESGATLAKRTNAQGYYRQNLLPPGDYRIRVTKQGYVAQEYVATNYATRPNPVQPPFHLQAETTAVATATPEPSPAAGQPTPTTSPATTASQTAKTAASTETSSVASEMNISDARRGGAYTDKEVSTLPLGGTTLTRSFDELGLLVPGVAPPPQTESDIAGPGVGPTIGSSGQFAVNGMRSRANNFMVDGSDNNDEDIGVRRQGFFSLVPQPIESVKEFQIITLLAPAQFGRNFGGQVNALSKSGGNRFHGTIYGFFNSSQLNARNFFDTITGNATTPVRSSTGQAVLDCGSIDSNGNFLISNAACITRNRPITVTNQSDREDSLTLGQSGGVLGGPIVKDKAFFFVSYENQILNATKKASFAVPTIDRRGLFNTGATGLFADCLTPLSTGFNISNCTPGNSSHFFPEFGFPTASEGDAVFSLFPFPNNPTGIYGANTFTEVLPASARGNVVSGKYDQNFKLWGKPQTLTARYNFTQDWRDIPVTGGALFSALRPRSRTQNFSSFLTSELTSKMSNILRLSYGRTRLAFDELRDPFLIPSQVSPSEPFLLNAPRLENDTINPLPIVVGGSFVGVPNTGPVLIRRSGTVECGLNSVKDCSFADGIARVGQINIAGFSPVGVDVNFFPQRRVNNTYQIADTLGYRAGNHNLAFGEDIRRVELNSSLPRNSRTLLTFNGAPEPPDRNGKFTGNFIPGIDFAAAGANSGGFLSLARTGSAIGLRYYEYNIFGQDQWQVRRNFSINFGLRYEYNTPPREVHNLIEQTFSDPALNNPNVAGLKTFVAGRTQIFDRDRNNFAPRVGIAWSPNWFGSDRSTVIRAGFGLFYDQTLGAVVSQSRNVFPNFVTVNTAGFGAGGSSGGTFSFFNPARGGICLMGDCVNQFVPLVQPGTLNTFNPRLTLNQVLNLFAGGPDFPNPISVTLPDRFIKTPSAEHYSVSFEQQLSANTLLSVSYIGTRGHNLLRATTPNLGPNNLLLASFTLAGVDDPDCFPTITPFCSSLLPSLFGYVVPPGNIAAAIAAQNPTLTHRPVTNAGPVFIYDSGGGSHYDALQIQMRGRFRQGLQYQANYTFSKSRDDASDVFDLAGAAALPQDSLTRAGEFALSNFDARHRVAYNLIYDFPNKNKILNGLQIASAGSFQTGQPFTVNSIFDVNGDGNLTDRLGTTQGIVITGDRSRPIALASGTNPTKLLAAPGQDGAVGRNSFRAGNILNLDLAVVKNFSFSEHRRLIFRMDMFNFINRDNFGVPVRFLESPSFGQATSTVTPGRRIQFGLKFSF